MVALAAIIATMSGATIKQNKLNPVAADAAVPGRLLVLCGLPGSGKSVVASALKEIVDCEVIRTDSVRQTRSEGLSRTDKYGDAATEDVYRTCHLAIAERLGRGIDVVFDATNSKRQRREALRDVARSTSSPISFCLVACSDSAAKRRITLREQGQSWSGDASDANWKVFLIKQKEFEPLARDFLHLLTDAGSPADLAERVASFWIEDVVNG